MFVCVYIYIWMCIYIYIYIYGCVYDITYICSPLTDLSRFQYQPNKGSAALCRQHVHA